MVRIHLRATATALSLSVLAAAAACSSANEYAGSGGAASCDTCANVYTNGGIVCAPGSSSDAWQALALCACDVGPCESACYKSFCQSMPADMACGTCLVAKCAAQETTCAGN